MSKNQLIASTISLRPRDFQRTRLADEINRDDEELYLRKMIPTIRDGTFLEIHTRSQERDRQMFKFREDKKILKAEEAEYQSKIKARDDRRDMFIKTDRLKRETNTKTMADIDKRWKATQRVKRDRRIRHLQYELFLKKEESLKNELDRQKYDKDVTMGVVEFEKIMKRSGIGADAETGNPSISYEDGEAFIERLEKKAQSNWPTNEECSDFLNQLKERTNEKRVARYEKERRKRRTALSQQQESKVP